MRERNMASTVYRAVSGRYHLYAMFTAAPINEHDLSYEKFIGMVRAKTASEALRHCEGRLKGDVVGIIAVDAVLFFKQATGEVGGWMVWCLYRDGTIIRQARPPVGEAKRTRFPLRD